MVMARDVSQLNYNYSAHYDHIIKTFIQFTRQDSREANRTLYPPSDPAPHFMRHLLNIVLSCI